MLHARTVSAHFRSRRQGQSLLTIESRRVHVIVFDDALIIEEARGSVADIDEDRIVRSIDGFDDKSVRRILKEQQIRVVVRKIRCGAIQVADDTIGGIGVRKDGIAVAGGYMVGSEVEVVKRWVGRGEDERLESEGR